MSVWNEVNSIRADLDMYFMQNDNIVNLEQLHKIAKKVEVLDKRLKKEHYRKDNLTIEKFMNQYEVKLHKNNTYSDS